MEYGSATLENIAEYNMVISQILAARKKVTITIMHMLGQRVLVLGRKN